MYFQIFGDSISGNCLKVKWTADLLRFSYDWVATDVMKAETRTEEFLALNPAGQVPAVRFADGRMLSQSNAIITYLAEEAGSKLMPKDPWERALVNQWLFWEQYSHEPTIAVRRFRKAMMGMSDAEIDPALLEKGNAALQYLEEALTNRTFLLGDEFTVADISLVAYTRMAEDGGYCLSAYPAVTRWIARVEEVLGLEAYPGYKNA